MRTLKKNKQKLNYSLLVGEQPVYELDDDGNKIVDYIDEEGKEYYRETGEYELVYSEPVSFLGNISMSGGEIEAREYGLSVTDYDAILVMNKGELPISETSLIWHKSEVAYKNIGEVLPDANSADYRVRKVAESLNQAKYLLQKVVK